MSILAKKTGHLKTALLMSAGAALLAPASATAQSPVEEIIVTARQRAESITDVPASITAITADTLQRAGVTRAHDFIALTPGVTLVDTAEVGDTQVNIRGINGARDAENSFALIIDGVLMTNPAAFNREYTDLQQIEILKGPQGALYGRNAAAGAIIVSTKKPSDTFEGTVKVSYAQDNTYTAAGYVSGPVSGNLYAKLSADYRSTDGFFRNKFLNRKNVDDFEGYNVNGRLLWDTENGELDIKARYGEVHAASITFNAAFNLPAFTQFGLPNGALFDEDVNKHQFTFENNIDPDNDQQALEVSAKYESEFNAGTLTAWVLYSDIENDLTADGTSGAFGFFNADPFCRTSTAAIFNSGYTLAPPQILFAGAPEAAILGAYTPTGCDGTQYQERFQDDISAEIRFASPGDQDLRWLVGAYALDINRRVGVNTGVDKGQGVIQQLFLPANSSNPTEQLVHDKYDSQVLAVFGQLAYDVTPDLEASLALRYDRERRKVKSLVPTTARTTYIDFVADGVFRGGAPLNPALNPAINPTGVIAPQKRTFDELEPKVALSYDATDDVTLFANWGIGFKSGGFNSQGSAATVNLFINQPLNTNVRILDSFEEEKSSAFEVGFKSTLMDDRFTLNGAAYYVDMDQQQFFEFIVGPFGLLRVVNNIDDAEIYGAELGMNWQVFDELAVFAGGNVLDSKIKKMLSRPDAVGNKVPYTANYTLNYGAQLTAPVTGEIDLVTRADFNTVGPTWFHVIQCQSRPTLFGFPSNGCNQERDSFTTVDLRVGFETEMWSLTAFAKNLTNSKHLEEVIPAAEFGGAFIHPAARRRIGVEGTLNF
ncbi:MAG: TonB-dependent receptor [Rhodospirillaceae bacterium]|nr:TonB-dependent receptor [Rhodospirillaceae bacterium]